MRTPWTRAESNQRNSRRSTGPKTAEGKARSSRNAIKHGLAAEALLPGEASPEVIAARTLAMAESLQPKDQVERQMSDRAAFLAIRLERCATVETIRTSERVNRAIADHDAAILVEVRGIVDTLPLDPAGTLRKLKRTAQGVDQLVDLWQEIRDVLAHGADLVRRDHDRLAHLLGRHAEASCFPPILMMARGAIQGDFGELPDPAIGFTQREATRRSCRHKLDKLIETQIDQLEAHRLRLPLTRADLDRREAPSRAVVDLSHQGMLLRRYETAAAREMSKIFAYFDRNRSVAVSENIDATRCPADRSIRLASFGNFVGSEGLATLPSVSPDPDCLADEEDRRARGRGGDD